MKDNRQAWLDLVLKVEGGWSDHPADPGGCTHRGITLATLSAWRRQNCTPDDLRKLTVDETTDILSGRYWNAVQGDKLPPGLDVAVADMAVHSGVRQAARRLQLVLGCKPDGHIGGGTLERARAAVLPSIILAFCESRLQFLQRLSGWQTFSKGWTARVGAIEETALALAAQQAAVAPLPIPKTKNRISLEAAVAAGGAIIAAIPAARDAYVQASAATAPLGELAVWLPAVLGLAVALGTLALLTRRGLRLADQQ